MAIATKNNVNQETVLKPEVHVIEERCAGCQECVIRCPTQALTMNPSLWIATANNDLCVGCRQCVRTCPFAAIKVEGPMLVAQPVSLETPSGTVSVGDIKEARPGFSTLEDAVAEARRCLNCPDPTCVRGCPVHNNIPAFI